MKDSSEASSRETSFSESKYTDEDIIDVDFSDLETTLSSDGGEGPADSEAFRIYADATQPRIREDALSAFHKAFEGFTGMGYTPLALIGTQVVAGINYSYFCRSTNPSDGSMQYAIVTVYRNLSGGASLMNISEFLLDETKGGSFPKKGSEMLCGGWAISNDNGVLNMPVDYQRAFDKAYDSYQGTGTVYPNFCLGKKEGAKSCFAILGTILYGEDQPLVAVLYCTEKADGTAEFTSVQPIVPGDYAYR